ncbi:hypothetical protein AVEN_86529-1 [Araneus ventricosus]|uniref:Uncharacterized protein n=1 Tax=Araneus ventricosus TaxID=182803 RepID=A0A4Y2VLS5_ARAVE|nr:hypothetical protein AVEN_86529-1 [Araneus ventricosus]
MPAYKEKNGQKSRDSNLEKQDVLRTCNICNFGAEDSIYLIRSMRSFAFITSNKKSGGLSRSSNTKTTQSVGCWVRASVMLHFCADIEPLITTRI